MSTSAPTVQEIIDRARARHWSFAEGNDGAAVQYLDERQRATLLTVIKTAEAFIGQTTEISTDLVSGTILVAVDGSGVPYYTTTADTAYPIALDANSVPYIDVDTPLTFDPFGEDGDAPGLPLPADILRLISVDLMTSDSDLIPRRIDIINPETVHLVSPQSGLRAFLSANRLIPIRTDTADVWTLATSIRVNAVICPSLTAPTDLITVPTPLIHAMTAALAEWLAVQSAKCPQQDKQWFSRQRAEADDLLDRTVNSMDAVTTSRIIYRR